MACMAQTYKEEITALPDQTSIWLAAWLQQSTRQLPTELILDGKAEKKQYRHNHPSNRGSSTMKQNELSWLGKMTNRELNVWSSNGVAYHAFTHLIILVNQILGLHQRLHTESAPLKAILIFIINRQNIIWMQGRFK